ncbi:MAG: tetratricopeptide repeat protein [Gemmatimonadales bacterium]
MRHLFRAGPIVCGVLFLVGATDGAAQSPADRASLQAFLDTIAGIQSAANLTPLDVKASGPVALIRAGLIDMRRAELGGSRGDYDEATRTIEEAVYKEDDWPWPWFALGQLRLSQSRRGVVVKETRYLGQGISYRRGAMDAFARSLSTDPTFIPAANGLASLVVAMGHRLLSPDFLPPLQKATGSANMPPELWLAIYRLEFGLKRYDAALNDLGDYLRHGGDSGMARLEQSRTLMALGRGDEAVATYQAGLATQSDLGRAAYREDLSWVAANWELAQYDSLAAKDVGAWVTRFWRERDALALRGKDERLREHIRRWVFVHQNYLIHRPDDAPIHAEGLTDTDVSDLFEPSFQDNYEVLSEVALGPPRLKTYERTQWEVDDRGVIYLRHGEPVEKASEPTGAPNESWAYDLPEGRRLFHFLGSRTLGTTAATTLVAALPLTPEMMNSRANLDSRYAGIAARIESSIQFARSMALRNRVTTSTASQNSPGPTAMDNGLDATGGGRFSAGILQREVNRNRKAIAAGVTSDGFPQVFKKSLDAVMQVYGVGLGSGEKPRLLAVFAVPGRKLTPKPRPDGGAGVLYPITIRLIAMDREHDIIRQLDTTRTFLSREPLTGDQHLTGMLELPVPPGTYQIRTLVTAEGVDAATGSGRDSVVIPAAPQELVISDLILGREQSGMSWSYAGTKVPLNPLNAYPRGADADLFYEVGGLTGGGSYQVTTAVRKADADPKDKPALQSTFALTASAPYQLVTRGIGLANLKPGSYLLEVTVKEAGTTREVTRRRSLNILEK